MLSAAFLQDQPSRSFRERASSDSSFQRVSVAQPQKSAGSKSNNHNYFLSVASGD